MLKTTLLLLLVSLPLFASSFDDEIQAFDRQDSTSPPPADPFLAVGSSSIRLWATLVDDFAPLPALNRGFGGSKMSDLLELESRLIVRYRPRVTLIYEGDNDLDSGKTPERIVSEFEKIEQDVHRELPDLKLVLLSIKPSPSRVHLLAAMRKTNQLLEQSCRNRRNVFFLNVFDAMLRDGKPRQELFQDDELHLNAAGYALWKQLIVPPVKALMSARR